MNKKAFSTITLLLSWGFAAGFVSLAIASMLEPLFSSEKLGSLFLLVIIEEMSKLGALFSLFNYGLVGENDLWSKSLLAGAFFGFGFSIFETGLIYLSNGEIPLAVWAPVFVHLSTSILLTLAIRLLLIEKRRLIFFALAVFAVILHLCYNVLVAIGFE